MALYPFAPGDARTRPVAPDRRPLIIIDPGHGGHDPGAISVRSRREKDATLQIALAVRERLARSGKVRVRLTRSDDRFVGLFERRQFARRMRADLFLSIHADSSADAGASGPTIYTLSDLEAVRVADRLNARGDKSDVISGADLNATGSGSAPILIDIAQGLTRNAAGSFVRILQQHLSDAAVARTFHRSAAFAVLKAPDMPSVLLETGYLSNPDDEARLFSRKGQARTAGEIADAVERYFLGGIAGGAALPPSMPAPMAAAPAPAPARAPLEISIAGK